MRRIVFPTLVFFCLTLPSVVPGQELVGPAEGKARVYFFYFLGSWAGRQPVQLFDGRSYVGFVLSSNCYALDLDPGEHLLWSKSANQKWFLPATVEAGRTYYVHLLMLPPKWAGPTRPSLFNAGSNEKRGKKVLKKINQRLAENSFAVQEPATAEHIETNQKEMGLMIEGVMATWDETWSTSKQWDVLHAADYVK